MPATGSKKSKGGRPRATWDDTYYVRCYVLACQGKTDPAIAKELGVGVLTLSRWRRDKPALEQALTQAREPTTSASNNPFADYLFQNLSPEMKVLWEEFTALQGTPGGPARRVNQLSTSLRQHLFLHAFVQSNYSASEACRFLGVSYQSFSKWVKEDSDFARLWEEMDWHKGNFFESALIRKVSEGDSAATIFANRTYNRLRGYGEKVEVTGSVQHSHMLAQVDVDDLELPLEVRRALLEALRRRDEQREAPKLIEYREVEDAQ